MLVFVVGWSVGHLHQYYSVMDVRAELEREVVSLRDKVAELSLRRASQKKLMSKIFTVKTTAYSNDEFSINYPPWRDGLTATGTAARRGVAAADWSVFPPGTVLYIPGYGKATVEDRGGAVRGYHLDLFMDTRDEALSWGVRQKEVIVLEMGSPKLLVENVSGEISPSP
ncbi:MAG: hypothetical protein Kow0025_10840 [Thermodesulfovibrionales bacterium]